MVVDIVFQHQDFIVVNKPTGLSVHSESGTAGIVPILCQQLTLPKLWLAHRLDKVTSGLLILAKNAQAAAHFGQLFEEHRIQKYYLAVSAKKPKKKQGAIIGDMRRVRDGKWALSLEKNNPARTQFFSKPLDKGQRLFILKPLTGKTHQLRVAMKSLGSPILGDTLYKGETADRVYLHAFKLEFEYKQTAFSLSALPENGILFGQMPEHTAFQQFSTPETLTWPNPKQ